MASFLDRYYALILALALPAPLWFGGVLNAPLQITALQDGIIWSAVLLALWVLVRKFPRYRLHGEWRRPTTREFTLYFRLMLAVLIIDFGSKALFFRWDRPYKVELFKNFGLHSVFHPTEFDSFHIYLLLYFSYLFMIGPLYFRLANRTLDRLWITFCAVGLGGTLALVTERLLFDGVHNSFYFAGPLMWLCPPCASPRFISYAWTPADFFCHAVVLAIFLPVAGYFAPSSVSQRGTLEPSAARFNSLAGQRTVTYPGPRAAGEESDFMASTELIVDVHHHYMPAVLFDRLAAQAGGKRIVTKEISLTLHPSRKDLDAHIRSMDQAGVTVSILTDQVQVMGADVARALNDGVAEVEKRFPKRFRSAIHLPVHEPQAAERELQRGIHELGLRAVALLACHLDIQLDHPSMFPLYEIIQKNNLPIIIHPQSKPTGSETTYNLDRCVFRPLETTQGIVRVMNAVLPRFPELRFIMPHLGGGTSSLKGRMMAFFETEDAPIPSDMRGYLKTQNEQKKFGLTERFEKLFRRLYFDTAGTGAWLPSMAAALNITSADRIMFGSDYPLECKTAENIIESLDMVRQTPCSAEDRLNILGKTAAGLFNLG